MFEFILNVIKILNRKKIDLQLNWNDKDSWNYISDFEYIGKIVA